MRDTIRMILAMIAFIILMSIPGSIDAMQGLPPR